MSTNFKKAPLSSYSVEKIGEGESGYNYYAYVHPMGQVIIMREQISSEDILFADGGLSLTTAWADRVTLDYTTRDQI